MAFSFPTSPANGDIYTQGPVTFTYNSTIGAWVAAGTGVRSLPAGTSVGQTIHWNGTSWGAGTDVARNVLAASASTPTARDDGTVLEHGDIYTDTNADKIMVWTGSAWLASGGGSSLPSGTTAGQTLQWDGTAWVAGQELANNLLTAASSNPTARDDGSSLVAGDIYANTTTGAIMVWSGTAWIQPYTSGIDASPTDGASNDF